MLAQEDQLTNFKRVAEEHYQLMHEQLTKATGWLRRLRLRFVASGLMVQVWICRSSAETWWYESEARISLLWVSEESS